MKKNNTAIDYLRAFVIVLVLAFHAILAYVSFAPSATPAFASMPYFWAPFPIVDSQRWKGFDLFALFSDAFFMSLMFFLAGLFVWSSIARKGRKTYLRDRCLRLGLPFAVVGIFLIPLAYYPSYLLREADPSIWTYFQQWLSLDSWPSGPCWFIAVLLILDFLTVLLHRFAAGWIQILGKLCSSALQRPARFFFCLLAISIVTYLTMRLAFGPTRWFSFGPFAVQASRVLLYSTYFFAGVGIGVCGIDHGLLARDGRLAQRWPIWLGAAASAFVLLVFFTIQLRAAGAASSLALQGITGAAFTLSCGATSFFLLAVFVRFANRRIGILDSLSANAYGMYLIHYFFVTWTQYALLDVALPASQKGVIVFVATLLLSWGTIAAIRLIPSIDRILSGRAPRSADAVTPNNWWMQEERRRVLWKRLLLAALGVFVCFIAYSQIKFSRTSVATRAAAPARIAVPADIDQLLKNLGNAYGSADGADVAQFLSDDFLHQGMHKTAFLHHLKTNRQYLGKLTITPVGFELQNNNARVVAYAESSLGPLGPSLQLLPLHIGATLVKERGVWKLRGNQQATEAALYKRVATIAADFVPADLALYQRLLPADYAAPAKPLVRVSVTNWLDMEPPQIPYRLAALSILARKNGQNIWYLLAMPETDWLAVEAGKAVGFPKFVTDIEVRRSLGNQWAAEIRNQGTPMVSFSFDPSPAAQTYFKENGQPNSDVWLLFGKDGAAVKASMIPLGMPTKFKLDYGWLTVNGFASPWKDLILPGSRAAGTSVDFTGGLKLNMYGLADATNIPAGVPELLQRTAVAWADQNLEQVMAQHHPAFDGHNGMDLVAMRRLFSFVRQYDWKIKDIREERNIAYVNAVIQTEAGEFPVITRFIKEGDRWYILGNQSRKIEE